MHHKTYVRSTLVSIGAALLMTLAVAREPVPIDATRFVGEISLMPKRGIGLWRIASRQVTSDALTELVTMSGPFLIGTCVQVDVVREKVLKIETLRPDEC